MKFISKFETLYKSVFQKYIQYPIKLTLPYLQKKKKKTEVNALLCVISPIIIIAFS